MYGLFINGQDTDLFAMHFVAQRNTSVTNHMMAWEDCENTGLTCY